MVRGPGGCLWDEGDMVVEVVGTCDSSGMGKIPRLY